MTDDAVEETRLADRDRRIRQGERELADLLKRLELTLVFEQVNSSAGKFDRFLFYDAKPAPAPGPQLVKPDAPQ